MTGNKTAYDVYNDPSESSFVPRSNGRSPLNAYAGRQSPSKRSTGSILHRYLAVNNTQLPSILRVSFTYGDTTVTADWDSGIRRTSFSPHPSPTYAPLHRKSLMAPR